MTEIKPPLEKIIWKKFRFSAFLCFISFYSDSSGSGKNYFNKKFKAVTFSSFFFITFWHFLILKINVDAAVILLHSSTVKLQNSQSDFINLK